MKPIAPFVIAVAGMLVAGQQTFAQEPYPTRRVTVIVPSPAGSTTDALARLVAEALAAGPTGDLAFIVGERRQPLTKESFGNFFRAACDAAGVAMIFTKHRHFRH